MCTKLHKILHLITLIVSHMTYTLRRRQLKATNGQYNTDKNVYRVTKYDEWRAICSK